MRMNRVVCIVTICFFLLVSQRTFAQDPVYTQFYNSPLQLNPAFTGNTFGGKIALNYRSQWPSVPFAYNTYSASYDQYFKKLKSGFGVLLLGDDAGNGIFKTNKLSLNYAYRLRMVNNFYLKLGMEGAVVQSRLNWQKLTFFDQIDELQGPISPGGTPYPTAEIQPANLSRAYIDIGAGLLMYSKFFYVGYSMKHINTPDNTYIGVNENLFSGLPIRYSFHAGSEIIISDNKRGNVSFLTPNILYVQQGRFRQLNVGGYANLGVFFMGAWYRHAFTNPDAVMITMGARKGSFKFGYSYDITVSGLGINSGGSHEIGLVFVLNEVKGESKYNDCFALFR